MAEETKPAENAPAPTETQPATGKDSKPADGGDKPADSGPQIKDASLEFMSHQCGVLVIMKGGHMVDNSAWQKVEQLNVECETAGQGDPYGDCTSPGNYANMGSCEIGGGVKIAKVTQRYKLSDTIPGTSWTFADYMGTTTKAGGKTNERFNAMMADEEKRTRFVQQAQYLKQVLALVGVGEKDITILSTIRDTGSAAHPYGLTVDFTVNDTKRNHEVAKKLYTMQRQGKLCANQIIWEMKAPNPKAVSKSSTEDNLNTSNAPGSQPVPTACNPSAGSTDSSASTDSSGSSDSSASTDSSGSTGTETKPTETKPSEPKPKVLQCGNNLIRFPVTVIGDEVAKTFWEKRAGKGGSYRKFHSVSTLAGLDDALRNDKAIQDNLVVISPMLWASDSMRMSMDAYWSRLYTIIEKLLNPTGGYKVAGVVVLGVNAYAYSRWDAKQGKRIPNKAFYDRAVAYQAGRRTKVVDRLPNTAKGRFFMEPNFTDPKDNTLNYSPHRILPSHFTGSGPYARYYGPILKEYMQSQCKFKVGGNK